MIVPESESASGYEQSEGNHVGYPNKHYVALQQPVYKFSYRKFLGKTLELKVILRLHSDSDLFLGTEH